MPRLLLYAWDSADWKVINRLLDSGDMPHLKTLVGAAPIASPGDQHRLGPNLHGSDSRPSADGLSAGAAAIGPVHYLNHIIEQEQRSIKKRVNAKPGFRAFGAAWRTLQGYEMKQCT